MDIAGEVIRGGERRAVDLKNEGKLKNEKVLEYFNRMDELILTLD